MLPGLRSLLLCCQLPPGLFRFSLGESLALGLFRLLTNQDLSFFFICLLLLLGQGPALRFLHLLACKLLLPGLRSLLLCCQLPPGLFRFLLSESPLSRLLHLLACKLLLPGLRSLLLCRQLPPGLFRFSLGESLPLGLFRLLTNQGLSFSFICLLLLLGQGPTLRFLHFPLGEGLFIRFRLGCFAMAQFFLFLFRLAPAHHSFCCLPLGLQDPLITHLRNLLLLHRETFSLLILFTLASLPRSLLPGHLAPLFRLLRCPLGNRPLPGTQRIGNLNLPFVRPSYPGWSKQVRARPARLLRHTRSLLKRTGLHRLRLGGQTSTTWHPRIQRLACLSQFSLDLLDGLLRLRTLPGVQLTLVHSTLRGSNCRACSPQPVLRLSPAPLALVEGALRQQSFPLGPLPA